MTALFVFSWYTTGLHRIPGGWCVGGRARGSVRATGFCYPWTERRQPGGMPAAATAAAGKTRFVVAPEPACTVRVCGRCDDYCHLHHAAPVTITITGSMIPSVEYSSVTTRHRTRVSGETAVGGAHESPILLLHLMKYSWSCMSIAVYPFKFYDDCGIVHVNGVDSSK